jgi:Septum formation
VRHGRQGLTVTTTRHALDVTVLTPATLGCGASSRGATTAGDSRAAGTVPSGTASPPATTPAPPQTVVAPDPTDTVEPAPDTDLVGSIRTVMSMTTDRALLADPDQQCFDQAIQTSTGEADVRQAADRLAADPQAWTSIPRPARLPLVTAHVGCTEFDDTTYMVAMSTINSPDAARCVAGAWHGVLTADLVSSSLASGTGLDDLPRDVVRQLVDGAAACTHDEQWWIDDIAIEIDGQYDYTEQQARCVATNFVRTLGIATAIDRRVLTIPMLTLTDDELASIDLPSCSVSVTLPPMTSGEVGDCLADAFGRQGEPRNVGCDSPHNAEVLALTTLTEAQWPGLATVDHDAETACRDIVARAAPDRDEIGLNWSVPSRQVWERGVAP